MANHIHDDNRSIAEVLHTMKGELSEFVNTRVQIAVAELREKTTAWKAALPLLGAAAFLAVIGFLALTFTLIAALAAFLATDYAWAIAAGIVTAVYLLIAGVLGWLGYREVKAESLVPERTLRVLKADQEWIKRETRAA